MMVAIIIISNNINHLTNVERRARRATIANHITTAKVIITPSRRRVIGLRIALRLYIAYQQIARRH